jgi:hypothetical protein
MHQRILNCRNGENNDRVDIMFKKIPNEKGRLCPEVYLFRKKTHFILRFMCLNVSA